MKDGASNTDKLYEKLPELKENADELDGSSPAAETRSAPGDLAAPSSLFSAHTPLNVGSQPSTFRESDQDTPRTTHINVASPSCSEFAKSQNGTPRNGQTPRQTHRRGVRGSGFASGPPFPRHPRREAPWTSMDERQKQQTFELIEKEIDVMAKESQCGIGKWRPEWIQRFATKNWLLFWMCWFCAIQGMLVNGLIPSAISTIERRFQLSTSTIGRIMQFYDFGYVLLCIPVSYFGGRHSKSLVLSLGLSLMALGSFLFSTPHLIADSYTLMFNPEDAGFSKCDLSHSNESNDTTSLAQAGFEALKSCPSPENQPGTFRYVFLFCLAHFLHGIGATPLFTIGVSYIDENVGPALSSLYLGVFYAFAIFGPAFGFLASSTFLRYHTDFLQSGVRFLSIASIDESDPKWVGAWWVGFQLVFAISILAVFPILCLPKVLPESLKWHRTRLREETLTGAKKRTPECCGVPSSSKTAAVSGNRLFDDKAASNAVAESMPALKTQPGPIWYQFWLDIRHIPIAIYRILLNGPYMLITLGMSIDGLIITGASTFMSKYLERQFGVAPSKANMLIGAIMVPMAGIGTMLSGFVVQYFRMSCLRTLKFCIALLICSTVLTPMYFIYCDHDQLVGIERDYIESYGKPQKNDSNYSFQLLDACNSHCDCTDSEYHPVCAELSDGSQMAFYSPCYAGCQDYYNPLKKQYFNCSCAPVNTKGGYRRVKNGYCESKCTGLFAFLILFAPFCFFTFAVGVPLITVVLRTVDYAERSFALGIQWILVRIIGTIPAPVVFGWLFDVSCIRQHRDPCSGEHGSCMIYQNRLLADLFLAFTIAGEIFAICCLFLVIFMFSASLRDDPLPVVADEPAANNNEMEAKQQPAEFEPMLKEEELKKQSNDIPT